jgi:hypothetical protein
MSVIEDKDEFNDYMNSDELKQLIRANALKNLRDLIQESVKMNIVIEHEQNRQIADDVVTNQVFDWNDETAKQIIKLWNDPGIQHIYTKGHESRKSRRLSRRMENFFFTRDNYFDSHMERIFSPNYQPTVEDFVRLKKISKQDEFADITLRGLKVRVEDASGSKSRATVS